MTELRQLENETVRELGRRTAMLQAVTFAATQIVTATDWRHEIPELLRRLGLGPVNRGSPLASFAHHRPPALPRLDVYG